MWLWGDENPYIFRETHIHITPTKVNVWPGILGNSIIGALFIEGNLTWNLYHGILRENSQLEIQLDAEGTFARGFATFATGPCST